MNTEKAPINNIQGTPEQEAPIKKPALQYIISVSVGVITIVLAAASYYYGIIRF